MKICKSMVINIDFAFTYSLHTAKNVKIPIPSKNAEALELVSECGKCQSRHALEVRVWGSQWDCPILGGHVFQASTDYRADYKAVLNGICIAGLILGWIGAKWIKGFQPTNCVHVDRGIAQEVVRGTDCARSATAWGLSKTNECRWNAQQQNRDHDTNSHWNPIRFRD